MKRKHIIPLLLILLFASLFTGCEALKTDPVQSDNIYQLTMKEDNQISFSLYPDEVIQTSIEQPRRDGEDAERSGSQGGETVIDVFPEHGYLYVVGDIARYTPFLNFSGVDTMKIHTGSKEYDNIDKFEVVITIVAQNDKAVLSGNPTTQISVGQDYYFKPTVIDADGTTNKLVFSIVNKPFWASFDSSTGVLSGTVSGNAVTYKDILISVKDGDTVSELDRFDINVIDAIN